MKNERWIGAILFLGLFLLSCRDWFFKSKIILGHNWDYTFPAVDLVGQNAGIISNYMWSDLTGPTLMLQSLIANNNIYALLVGIVGTSNSIKIIYFIMILVGYMGTKKLVKLYTGIKDIEASILGLFYAFSPYAFSIIIGGSWNAWISYAFSPLLIYSLIRVIIEGRTQYYWLLLPTTVFTICFPHFFLIDNIIFIAILSAQIKDRINFYVYAKRYIYLIIFNLIINLYWLIPFIYHAGEFNQKIYQNNLITSFEAIKNSLQTAQNIIYLIGFNNRNFYINSLNKYHEAIYISVITIIIGIVIYSYLLKKSKKIGGLELLFIIFFLLSSGGNGPLGMLSIDIHEKIGFLKMYRNPQNMYFSIIIISILILARAIKEIDDKKIILILVACLPFYMMGWILNGDFGTKSLEKKNISHVDFYRASKDIEDMYLFYENISIANRPFFLPNTQSPLYIKNQNQGGGQGGVAEYLYMKNQPYLISDTSQLRLIYGNLEGKKLLESLGEKSVRYITIRNDIVDYFNGLPKFYNKMLESALSKKIELIEKQNNYTTFLVPNQYFRPIISLIEIGNLDNKRAIVEFKKISPIRYDLNIRNMDLKKNYKVVFNSQYNEKWEFFLNNNPISNNEDKGKINLDNYNVSSLNVNDQANIDEIKDYISKGKIDLEVFKSNNNVSFISKEFSSSIQNDNMKLHALSLLSENLPNKFHGDEFKNNKNVNVFDINLEYLIENFPYLIKKNKDGNLDLSASIYLKTQYILYIGLVFSLILTIGFLLFLKKRMK